MKSAANTLKNVTLETGGRIPILIFEDAEMEQAVKWSHFGIGREFGEAGMEAYSQIKAVHINMGNRL